MLIYFLISIIPIHLGHFWQLTDLHWDQRYSTNGDPSQMCHSDSLSETNAGKYGTFGCDAPWDLVELSIKGMASNDAVPDFIFWTGSVNFGYHVIFHFL